MRAGVGLAEGDAVVDTLSDVLRSVQLAGAAFFELEVDGAWELEVPAETELPPHLARGAKHVIGYHVVTRGSCWVSMAGEPALELVAGAVLVFPHGDPYVISSQPERLDGALSTASTVCVPLAVKRQQGAAASARVISGFLGCDERPFDPLLSTLPRVMPLGAEPEDESVTRRLTELALVESRSSGAGSSCVLARLGELLFVDAVRRYV